MARDLKPLVEKLTASKEKVSVSDFEALFALIRDLRADGRLSLRDMFTILQEVMSIFSDFANQSQPGDGDFGFDK